MHPCWLRFLTLPLLLGAAVLFPARPAQAQPSYVGSAACALCHKTHYEKWKDTLHNKSQQEVTVTNDPVVVNWAGTVKNGPRLRRFSGG